MRPPKRDLVDVSFDWREKRPRPASTTLTRAARRAAADRFANAEWEALAAAVARLPVTPRAVDEDL